MTAHTWSQDVAEHGNAACLRAQQAVAAVQLASR
jgi:hypothetical protein